ncbi:ATP-binding protein [Desulfovibrio sp. JC010]|uniref:ATP-binding protein n=1 Tax=Desulfovibrio sp. JC010 TaxID=2593641 RepID=UPI0013D3FD65|nr:ATP-binding protein [Desulfovibrio sp. JC010]NDV25226.1 HAMP domain-containing protein [Desulfovibrio sp. JC010]
MKKYRNSIGRKVGLAILGTTIVAVVLSMSLNIASFFHSFRQATLQKAASLTQVLGTSVAPALDFNDPDSATEALQSLALVNNSVGATIFTADGQVFAGFGKQADELPTRDTSTIEEFNNYRIIQEIRSGDELLGYILLDGCYSDQLDWFFQNLATSGLILFSVLTFCFLTTNYIRKKLTSPIGQLTATVRDISNSKDYTRRVSYRSDDEIGYLVTEFNSMLGKIEKRDNWLNNHREMLENIVAQRTKQLRSKQAELEKKNKLLVQQIHERRTAEMIRDEVERINRHDLKSSLNLVIGYPELILNSDEELTPNQRKYVKRIASAGYRMLDMIQFHLDMFKMEQGIYRLKTMRIDLIDLMTSLEEEMALLLNQSGVKLSIMLDGKEIEGMEELHLTGEGMLLRTMFRNLIKNAVEASNEEDTVTIAIKSGPPVSVTVKNTLAVPEEVRERFFDKYVTLGKEDGTGLGTYSAKLIAETHKAEISMHTAETSGTEVTTSFVDESSAA